MGSSLKKTISPILSILYLLLGLGLELRPCEYPLSMLACLLVSFLSRSFLGSHVCETKMDVASHIGEDTVLQ